MVFFGIPIWNERFYVLSCRNVIGLTKYRYKRTGKTPESSEQLSQDEGTETGGSVPALDDPSRIEICRHPGRPRAGDNHEALGAMLHEVPRRRSAKQFV